MTRYPYRFMVPSNYFLSENSTEQVGRSIIPALYNIVSRCGRMSAADLFLQAEMVQPSSLDKYPRQVCQHIELFGRARVCNTFG